MINRIKCIFCLIYDMYGVFDKEISNTYSNKRMVLLKLNINNKIHIFNVS